MLAFGPDLEVRAIWLKSEETGTLFHAQMPSGNYVLFEGMCAKLGEMTGKLSHETVRVRVNCT